jgi:8-hydroxy-5-deazaflavin:NADPH oxidoreductase
MTKIAVLGTGMVGKAIGTKLIELGHEVMMGSRTQDNEKAREWKLRHHELASHGTFADAAAFGEIVFNCTKGMLTLEILASAGADNLAGKILVDVTNPLDFTRGFPPTLTVCNDNSLGEEIQKHFPETKVVKALNTMNCEIMVNPSLVNGGDHDVFICGNDSEAKATTSELLISFGWDTGHIVDLGDITNSRGTEQILPLWVRVMGTVGTPMFQFKIVK